MNIICCSGGNDSVALIQWAKNNHLENVTVLYNDTKWAIDWWPDRMKEIESLCRAYDFNYAVTESEGFTAMVRRKKCFPMAASKMSFCTEALKKQPTRKYLDKQDPLKKAIIYIGVRREESQNRKNHPVEVIGDKKYGGRVQRFPLVEYGELERDILIEETGIDILMHGSMECFPCINSNRANLRMLSKYPDKIYEISELEKEMGYTKKGEPKVMFRPYRHMGATGIREIVKWALCERGKYRKS